MKTKNKIILVLGIICLSFYTSNVIASSVIEGIPEIPQTPMKPVESQVAEYGNFKYTIKDDEITIVGYKEQDNEQSIVIPETIENLPVKYIRERAFENCCNVKEITISEGIVSIGDYAFSDCDLSTIMIPSSITNLGLRAFSYDRMESINVAEGNTEYSSIDGVLSNKEKTKIISYPGEIKVSEYKIPDGIKEIEEEAFASCEYLEKVTIPEGTTSIGDYAFINCSNLRTIIIPSSVTNIGDDAFSFYNMKNINVSEENTQYSSIDGVLFNKQKTLLIGYPGYKEDDTYSIPNGVEEIEEGAFYGCSNLKEIIIPEGVVIIGDNAFNSSGIENINIPSTVTGMGDNLFIFCNSLKEIQVAEENKNYKSTEGVLFNKDMTRLMLYPPMKEAKEYNIPNGVKEIGGEAFLECEFIEEITIPNSIEFIYYHAFCNNNKLKSITFPKIKEDSIYEPITACENVTIYAHRESQIEEYAKQEEIKFIAIGDINKDEEIDTEDARLILQYCIGEVMLTKEQLKIANVNDDGEIGTENARKILLYNIGQGEI